jgi:hypothetical protein
MISALRVSLAIILVPIGMLAAFFVCYAVLHPAFWVANVTPAGKAFQVGATIIAAATALYFGKERAWSAIHGSLPRCWLPVW